MGALRVEDLDADRGYARLRIEGEDDLWLLSILVEEGDVVASRTSRDVGVEGAAKKRVPMVLAVRVKGVEFQPFSGRLRIRGVIVEGPEEYGLRGSHHTLSIDVGMSVELWKASGSIDRASLEKILELSSRARGLLVALDHEEYAVASVQGQGVRILEEGYLEAPSKRDPESQSRFESSLSGLAERVLEHARRHGIGILVLGSPGTIASRLAEALRRPGLKVFVDTTSTGGRAGIEELLRRGAAPKILREQSSIEAEEILREYLETLSKSPELTAAGLDKIVEASRIGAIKVVAIIEDLLKGGKETRKAVEETIANTVSKGGRALIVPSESPAGSRLKLMGKAIAILRFPMYPQRHDEEASRR